MEKINVHNHEKKERIFKLNIRMKLETNEVILQNCECLSQNSPIIGNFVNSLSERSYPTKTNPDGLVYELW